MNVKIGAFLVSAIVSLGLGLSTTSHAITDVRAPGFACSVVNGTQVSRWIGEGNDSTTATLNVACPVPDVYNGIQDIGTVQVEIDDRSTTAAPTANRCVSLLFSNNATVTSCGPAETAPAAVTGHLTFKPPGNADWAPANFGYMSVILPARTSLGRTTVNGIHAF